MLPAGRQQIPDEVIRFFIWPNPSSRTVVLGVDSAFKWNENRNLPGDKGRPARKVVNLTAIREPIL
jgi:hypothetical protein